MSDNLPTKFDADSRHRFLAYYALTGQLVASSRHVGISSQTVRDLRKKDPTFDAAMTEAQEDFKEHCEREAYRRAFEGTEEGIFQGGEEVGTKRVYSDAILMMILKKLDPSYKEKHEVSVNVSPGVLAIPATETEDEWEKRNSVEADYDVVPEQSEEPDEQPES